MSITGNGVLDIGNNTLFISYYDTNSDPISSIAAYLKSGFNGGHWNGPGIISSAAQTTINGHRYGVGWADSKDKIAPGLSSGQIEVKYTLLGDANLDGTVNGSDFSILAANFGQGATNWDQGNFLFTPAVNGSDFRIRRQLRPGRQRRRCRRLLSRHRRARCFCPCKWPEPSNFRTGTDLWRNFTLGRRGDRIGSTAQSSHA